MHAGRGLLEEGRAELQHAVRCRRVVPRISPWATLEATLLLVRVELDLGNVAAAAELIGEANDVLTLFPDGTRFQQVLLARLRRRLAAPRTANRTDSLTERELAVLQLLPGALSLRENAEKLYLSVNTRQDARPGDLPQARRVNQRRRRQSRPGCRNPLS